jgi:hypothetical protein
VLYLIGAVVFFRWQILSTFDLISGSDETLLVAFIHEHVYRSFLIQVEHDRNEQPANPCRCTVDRRCSYES